MASDDATQTEAGSWVPTYWNDLHAGDVARPKCQVGGSQEPTGVVKYVNLRGQCVTTTVGVYPVDPVHRLWSHWERPAQPAAAEAEAGVWEGVCWKDLRVGDRVRALWSGGGICVAPDVVSYVEPRDRWVGLQTAHPTGLKAETVLWQRFTPDAKAADAEAGEWEVPENVIWETAVHWQDLTPGDIVRQRASTFASAIPPKRVIMVNREAKRLVFGGETFMDICSETTRWERVLREPIAPPAKPSAGDTPRADTVADLQLQARLLLDIGCDPRVVLGVLDERQRDPVLSVSRMRTEVAARVVDGAAAAPKTGRCDHGHALLPGACTACALVLARPDAAPIPDGGPGEWDRSDFEG